MDIRVLIADDHQMLRDDLRQILEKEEDIEVVGEANDGRTAVEMARALLPDVVIMDVGMPVLNGVEATRRIKAENPTVEVVALSMHSNRLYVLGMLEAGASGYVLKATAYDEVARAVRAVNGGESYLSPGTVGLVASARVGGIRVEPHGTARGSDHEHGGRIG